MQMKSSLTTGRRLAGLGGASRFDYRVFVAAARSRARRLLRLGLLLLMVLPAAGCASMSFDVGYYWQSISGHLAVMRAARPIDELLAEPTTAKRLRERLELVRDIRRFASTDLGLPDNGSYTRYAQLDRPYVLWNIFATPELSLKLVNWCFPIAGCISYRGYYSKADADRFAEQLRADGFEVYVGGVPAYSTLGWFDDPVLSSFIYYGEGELARLIFHELAHQVLYVPGDSTFNESFATAVEQAGVQRWLARRSDALLSEDYRAYERRRTDFIALLKKHRAMLEAVYAANQSDDDKRRGKAAVFQALKAEYQVLRTRWGGFAGYDRWFEQPLGNPHLASVATYTDAVPGFLRMLEAEGGELPKFFEAARALSRLDKAQRDERLGIPAVKP